MTGHALLLVLALQDTAASADTLHPVRCNGETVRQVEILARRPPFKGQMAIWRRAARAIGLHHATTRDAVVRRFVTLDEGAPCSDFRRAESERLLRQLPYLASASVRTFAADSGGVRVVVETVDEVPATGSGRIRGGRPEAISVGSINMFGTGLTLEAGVERGRGSMRDGFSGRLAHYQFLGHPWVLELEGVREPAGDRWNADASHPFLTDLQRVAWFAGARMRREYLPLARVNDSWLSLGVRRDAWDVGGVLRVGGGRTTWLAGGAVSRERSTADGAPSWLLDTAIVLAPASLLDSSSTGAGYSSFRALRVGPIAGVRHLHFVTARGLDALSATQDLARGVQVATMLQRGIARRGADDWLASADLFAGAGGQRSYAALQVDGEARRARNGAAWDGVLASGRAAWYVKPALPWTTMLSLEAAGGRRLRYPMLLELGSHEGGVRGLGGDPVLGTSRVVARLEQRWFAGSVRGRGDLGFATFMDVGRSWAGGNALATTTPTVATAGISLLAAVPRGAQRTLRLDLATGVRNASHGIELRVTMKDATRAFWKEPRDVAKLRATRAVMDVLSWP